MFKRLKNTTSNHCQEEVEEYHDFFSEFDYISGMLRKFFWFYLNLSIENIFQIKIEQKTPLPASI